MSTLSSGKIDKYECLTNEEILPSDKKKVIEQAKFTYSPIGKALEKQAKGIEEQRKKQIKAIKDNRNNWLNLMNLLKKVLISKGMVYHLRNKTKYLMNFLKKDLMDFRIKKKIILII